VPRNFRAKKPHSSGRGDKALEAEERLRNVQFNNYCLINDTKGGMRKGDMVLDTVRA
jgi:hypothetical protein